MVEFFEDFYYENPDKAEEFFKSPPLRVVEEISEDDDFDVPSHVQAMLSKRKGEVDIKKYQTAGDEELTDEECKKIFDSIRGARPSNLFSGEIDDDFTES